MNDPTVFAQAVAPSTEESWWRKIWVRFRGRQQVEAQPKELREFSAEVRRASDLLDFLMSEGHQYHIQNEIIVEVVAARDYLAHPADPPGKNPAELRAKLKQAYRELISISPTSVIFESIPPITFWNRHSLWFWSFFLTTVMPFIIYVLILINYWNLLKTYWDSYRHFYWYLLGLPIIYVTILVLAFWYLYVFTGVVTNNKLNQIIKFCYIFTFAIVAGSILPFAVPIPFSKLAEKAPLGILEGCALGGGDAGIPREVLCTGTNDHYQWVVNIGGVVERLAEQSPPERVAEPSPPAPIPKPAPPRPPSPPRAATPRPAPTAGATVPQLAPMAAATVQQPAPPTAEPKYRIRGGLVVPLYVMVLALIGSAVSMTRRVPEYQGHSMDAQDSLTNVKAREKLVFEIMQVISAPLIAITVYYIINPTTPMWSVVLGFGSGFASAPILLMIRSLVDRLSPTETAQPSLITVRVNPPSVTLEPGKPQQFTSKVLGTSNSEVAWLINPPDGSAGTISGSGYYVAPQLLQAKMVTITACSVADRTKSGSASVTVKPVPSPAEAAIQSPITVTVKPTPVTVKPEEAQKFSATVLGSSNSEVTWHIDPSDASAGTISASGQYVAPQSTTERTVTITARSAADQTRSGSASVTVKP